MGDKVIIDVKVALRDGSSQIIKTRKLTENFCLLRENKDELPSHYRRFGLKQTYSLTLTKSGMKLHKIHGRKFEDIIALAERLEQMADFSFGVEDWVEAWEKAPKEEILEVIRSSKL
jgi:hypothetical protein